SHRMLKVRSDVAVEYDVLRDRVAESNPGCEGHSNRRSLRLEGRVCPSGMGENPLRRILMNQLVSAVERALGPHASAGDLTTGQIALRAILVFLVWLVVVRLADRRLLGKYSAFDVVLAVMLGSVLSRAINGSAPFWGTLAAAAVLVALHWLL